jgi:hypothetical protein
MEESDTLIKSLPEASISVTPLSSNHEITGIISSGSGAIRSKICSVVHHLPVHRINQITLCSPKKYTNVYEERQP